MSRLLIRTATNVWDVLQGVQDATMLATFKAVPTIGYRKCPIAVLVSRRLACRWCKATLCDSSRP